MMKFAPPNRPTMPPEEIRAIMETALAFRRLIEFPAWSVFKRGIELRIESLKAQNGAPQSSIGDVLETERRKGEILGLMRSISMPHDTVQLSTELAEWPIQGDDEDAAAKSPSDADRGANADVAAEFSPNERAP